MSVAPIAIHVDDDVAAKFLAEIQRCFRHESDRQRVIAVDVKNWDFDHLRDVGGVHRGAGVFRQGGEADLVVDHDVHGSARAVAGQLRHVERFRHHALTSEGRVPMNEQRQNFPAMLGVASDALPRPRLSFDHRIDGFEMAGVGGEPNLYLRSGVEFPYGGVAEVIFHIAIALHEIGNVVGAELGEDDLERFAEKIRQHVEPSAVRHPHADLLDSRLRTELQDSLEDHHQRLRALQRKALLSDVASVQENLERLRFHQRSQEIDLDRG